VASSSCKCCGSGDITALGSIDFNRSCQDGNGTRVFPPSPVQVPYFACRRCAFVFTDAMDSWTPEQFKRQIYNADYVRADPPLPGRTEVPVRERPAYAMGWRIADAFEGNQPDLRVLDFGAGGDPGPTGLALQDRGFTVHSHDPYRSQGPALPDGTFGLIIAIEVFEHCHDLEALIGFMQQRLAGEGLLWIQTLLHPSPTPPNVLDSWYIAPRNGHISIFSLPALTVLFERAGINIVTSSKGLFGFKRPPRFPNRIFV
jgi:2-polyprenyl-6-hydroxyphenyl methylase/3-demethylubiquinone-9 3-methyltransferase